jgi:spore photoproduct lyase
MSKEFFKELREWSEIKLRILAKYLRPFSYKLGSWNTELFYVDGFAGRGVYEDESMGSPLRVLKLTEEFRKEKRRFILRCINVELDDSNFRDLHKHTSKLEGDLVFNYKGSFSKYINEILQKIQNFPTFFFIDPFGLSAIKFSYIEPLIKRQGITEIFINFSLRGLQRLGGNLNAKTRTEQGKKAAVTKIKTLTEVINSDGWIQIWRNELDSKKRDERILSLYEENFKKEFDFVFSYPIRETFDKRPKYYLIYATRHYDGIELMNDFIYEEDEALYQRSYRETFFPEFRKTDKQNLFLKLKSDIYEFGKQKQLITRKDIRKILLPKNFGKFKKKDYDYAIKLLDIKRRIKRQSTRAIKDDEILEFPDNHWTKSFTLKETREKYNTELKIRHPNVKIKKQYFRTLEGKNKFLVEKVNDGSIIIRFNKTSLPKRFTDVICPHFLELKWAYGCPYDCAWCYLKGTFRFHNGKILPGFKVKDFEKIRLHVEEFIDKADEPEILNTGEIADSFMYENGASAFSKFIIPIFERQRKHKILFVTKSDRIKNLLEINPHRQVIVSFSLNAIPVAEKWEKGAPKVLDRIEAAKKLSNENYEIRIRIDPMVPIENWQRYYKELIDLVFSNFIPERITFGSLRGLQSTINGTKDTSWVHYLKETSNWGKKIDFTTRLKMYSNVTTYLKKKYRYDRIAFCKETKAMWQKLGMDYKNIKCNCVW